MSAPGAVNASVVRRRLLVKQPAPQQLAKVMSPRAAIDIRAACEVAMGLKKRRVAVVVVCHVDEGPLR